MLARLRRAVGRLDPRKAVGRDRAGNRYFLVSEYKDEKPRRVVEYKDDVAEPESVPILWHSWLRYNREEPPTPEEMDRFYAEQDALQERVRQLEEDDEKLRVQEHAERFMREEDGGAAGGDVRTAVAALINDGDVAEYERGIGGSGVSDAPTGSGDTFKPGTWSPNK